MRSAEKSYPYYVRAGEKDDYGEIIWDWALEGSVFGWLCKIDKLDLITDGVDLDRITHIFITTDDIYKGDKIGSYIIDDTYTEHRRKVAYLYEWQ